MKKVIMCTALGVLCATAGYGGQALISFAPNYLEGPEQPLITRIYLQGTNVIVTAQVPAGYTRVFLEGAPRVAGETWTPKAVARPNRQGGTLSIQLPQGTGVEMLRLRADTADLLPELFFKGPSAFEGYESTLEGDARAGTANGGGVVLMGDSAGPLDFGTLAGNFAPTRTVVESDIWKLNGDRLYFFNQYRGLQVIDVGQPDMPVLLGTLALAAAGEQMYLLDDTHVVLLARDNCHWGSTALSQALVLDVSTGKPSTAATLDIPGVIVESRLVGTALYVASQLYSLVGQGTSAYWEAGIQVMSFDLSDVAHPAVRSTEWVGNGYNNVVTATDQYLFVPSQTPTDWSRSTISIFDIGNPDGTMKVLGKVTALGRVKDKFGINCAGEVLSIVSDQGNATYVETFSMANSAAPQKLGSLKVVEGESLYATRFDGDRLYAVTFRRIDPLWIIDLSNPEQPRVSGELQVPGFSTYLHPMGDRLLAIGRESSSFSQTTVSLFNVQDAGRPLLLKRVALGQQYSYSEANYDEKAFGVLPEMGLVLVPFTTWRTNGTSLSGVQLIDLSRDTLALRGVIEHDIQARRAAAHRDRILSLSGLELLTVDATDLDHPIVRANTLLSWSVDQVFVADPYLLELTTSSANAALGPIIRVTGLDTPDIPLSQLALTNLPFLGAALQGDRLYVVQAKSPLISSWWDTANQVTTIQSIDPGVLSMTVLDLSRLPALTVIGQTQQELTNYVWGSWQALWPKPGLLVWQSAGSSIYPVPFYRYPVVLDTTGSGILNFTAYFMPVGGSLVAWPIWGGYGPTRLLAYDVTDSKAPKFLSDVTLSASQAWGGTRRAFAADGLVYASHTAYETVVTGTNRVLSTNLVSELVTNIVSVTNITEVPQYTSVTNFELVTNVIVKRVVNRPPEQELWTWTAAREGILAAGAADGFILSPLHGLWAWGNNSSGQLGDGTYEGRKEILSALNFGDVRAVAAGQSHTLVLREDGTIWAAGAGSHGQLGNGLPATPDDQPPIPYLGSPLPVQTMGLSNIVAVAAGSYHSLAAGADGSVWSWGADGNEPLDSQSMTLHFIPARVDGLADITTMAAGHDHSLAIRKDGSVWGWGRNDYGQLGNGRYEYGSTPVPVAGLNGVVRAGAGLWYSLALKEDGTVWAWGNNRSAILGGSTLSKSAVPVKVPGLDNITDISGGRDHGLALKADGSVWSWGANDYGQLGDGTVNSRGTPAPVPGIGEALAVSAGRWFSMALLKDGSLVTWGRSAEGQLGNGTEQVTTNEFIRTNISVEVTYIRKTNITEEARISYVSRRIIVTNEWPIFRSLWHDYLDVVDYALPSKPAVRQPVEIPGQLQGIGWNGAVLYTIGSPRVTPGGSQSGQWLQACAYDGVSVYLVDSLSLSTAWFPPVLAQGTLVHLGRPAIGTNVPPGLETWTLSTTGRFTQLGSTPLHKDAQRLALLGDLLVVQESYWYELFDAREPEQLEPTGTGAPSGCSWSDLDKADGSLSKGLWMSLGSYGVWSIQSKTGMQSP